jgi:peptide-methionine (S)-S-oxide reductase
MMSTRLRSAVVGVLPAAAVLGVLAGTMLYSAQGEKATVVPPPALDTPAGEATSEVAVFGGGCFWGVQAVFQHVKGVTSAVSGYAGGERATARYDRIGEGDTGHAESVEVTFDPRLTSYGRLLQVFFSVAHDPTQRDRQGPDVGPQYRTAIFPASAEQERIAAAYIAQLAAARAFPREIATRIERNRPFFRAEAYHQDYLVRNPRNPYIVFNDLPKLVELQRVFPERYRAAPVLVGLTR